MPTYIFLAMLSMFLLGVFDYIYGRAVREGISVGTMTCSQACFFVPMVTLWSCLEGTYRWSPAALLGPVAAVFLFFGTWAFMQSVRLGEASVTTPIFRISFVVTVLVAILFLEERMTLRKGVGFLLAAVSIFLLSQFRFSSRGPAVSRDRTLSVLWAIAAMISVGLVNALYKIGVNAGVAPAMLLHSQGLFFITLAFVYAFFTQGGPRFSVKGWTHGCAAGACISSGLMALLAALKTGEASVVIPIGQLSFVVSALMAVLLLGEKFTARKAGGLLTAVATIMAFMPV